MTVEAEPRERYAFLHKYAQSDWDDLVTKLSQSIHPVDRDATRIWFAFWPIKLARGLAQTEDVEALIREWSLSGKFRLSEQLDSSVEFLWGSHFWPVAKQSVLEFAESTSNSMPADLEVLIRESARLAASRTGQDVSLLLGVSAVAWMALRQLGTGELMRLAERPSTRTGKPVSPDKLVRQRARTSSGLLNFLRTVDRRHRIVFNELSPRQCSFKAIQGQDVSMASANDRRDYTSQDPRRIEGPVPYECRSGSCGTCWIGVLGGADRLAEVSDFEVKRLRYFGYCGDNSPIERHPPVRLACQAQCFGDLTIVIPPWNGQLKGRE